ncbi:MAG: N-formylglutamate deformylase [Burkholderiales bacterium PBB4]|nr:MAG: N-formylglutamate deformylase [Burkholderiales bacterium PBB4]
MSPILPTPAVFQLQQGRVPLLVSMPHIGTHIPLDLQAGFVPQALQVEDTDWHLDQLYNFLGDSGASVRRPSTSRYVIDLNRPPDDAPMYPGASNTELCPTRFFNGTPLYQAGAEPTAEERERRRATYWQPYHDALRNELDRLKAEHGYALLWDAHSIRSEIPWLFEGRLPGLSIGTASGASANAAITEAVMQACARHPHVSSVANGRFKGGYITRHYGQPAQNIHAIQLEMCQSLYMQEVAPFTYDLAKAAQIQPVLKEMVCSALGMCGSSYEK